ncbi:hypothetical protein [Acinetobacter sp. 226-4]|uniref:hypothetical protein n=1 Tax=Acinetobacter sp. 226-4 TaxID=2746719 RepID=UPI002575434A|nr:hypothetical protein [Acinetobacter sp. 226-4]MDM1769297.1 hypothetical protein [Acinetobacter sp. 226-4]
MENFNAWIGKKEISGDFVSSRPVEMMQALLNQEDKNLTVLPHLYHWFYFLPIVDGQELAEDGHPKKGSFLPPIPFPKRMWAGGRLHFISPIHINQNIRRESEILKVELKHGKSGDMYFVTVKHSIYAEDKLAITEEHDIVYREASNQVQTQASTQVSTVKTDDSRNYTYKKQFPIDTVSLFRYSAITFNGHRIHYDRPYATQIEGYPGLIVHGPLLATLLLHTFKKENPNKEVSSFEFRAVNPVFDFNDFYICGDIQQENGELWIEKEDGLVAMKAKISFKEE